MRIRSGCTPKLTVTPHHPACTPGGESIARIAGKIEALHHGAALASLAAVVDPKKGY